MNDTPPTPPPSDGLPRQTAAQAARERMRQRVRRYKRGLTAAALLGFGLFGVVISRPNVAALVAAIEGTQST